MDEKLDPKLDSNSEEFDDQEWFDHFFGSDAPAPGLTAEERAEADAKARESAKEAKEEAAQDAAWANHWMQDG